MTTCREFFERLDKECASTGDSRIRAERVRAAERHQRLLDWEEESASSYSPGPVGPSETIRKALYQGKEISEGDIHRNSFLSLDSVGFSADRTSHTSPEDSKSRFASRATETHPLYGYVDVDVAHLRSMHYKKDDESESVRAIAVYDTAINDNKAHAEAFMIVKWSNTRPWKTMLADLMNKYKPAVRRY